MSLAAAQKLVQQNLELPTLPQVVAKINALVDDPDVSLREIGAAVAEDAPIAAKVLKIANSALFGLREKVVSTEHATAVLGARMLRTVAMQASVIRNYDHLRSSPEFDLTALWKHAILTGEVSAALASRCRARIGLAPEEFQVVGLLHDIGKILMYEGLHRDYLDCLREAAAEGAAEHTMEERRFGYHHGHVGALIASNWGMPALVADAIEYHHGPSKALLAEPAMALVALANIAAHRVEQHQAEDAVAVFDERAQRLLGLAASSVREVVQKAETVWPQIQI